jgi:hypothetical protein
MQAFLTRPIVEHHQRVIFFSLTNLNLFFRNIAISVRFTVFTVNPLKHRVQCCEFVIVLLYFRVIPILPPRNDKVQEILLRACNNQTIWRVNEESIMGIYAKSTCQTYCSLGGFDLFVVRLGVHATPDPKQQEKRIPPMRVREI